MALRRSAMSGIAWKGTGRAPEHKRRPSVLDVAAVERHAPGLAPVGRGLPQLAEPALRQRGPGDAVQYPRPRGVEGLALEDHPVVGEPALDLQQAALPVHPG